MYGDLLSKVKKMAFMAVISSAFFNNPLSAALPPLYESIKELYTILRTSELPYYLTGADPIEIIERRDNGWVIRTKSHTIFAEIVNLPSKIPGPQKFTIKWHQDIPPASSS